MLSASRRCQQFQSGGALSDEETLGGGEVFLGARERSRGEHFAVGDIVLAVRAILRGHGQWLQ